MHYPGVTVIDTVDNGHNAFVGLGKKLVNTIFVDPFGLYGGIEEATWTIFRVREEFPEVVFVLYIDKQDYADRREELYRGPRSRFRHYFHLLQDTSALEFGSELALLLCRCRDWHFSVTKRGHVSRFKYDVALSFAGEDREYAEQIAGMLRTRGVRVFYDSFEKAELWGRDLFSHLHKVYSEQSRFCIMFVSKAYAEKMWTVHERRSAQARALREREHEYILPLRIDDTELPGLPDTVSYIDLKSHDIGLVAKLFVEKLGGVLEESLLEKGRQ